jgi:hypothetical protein
LKGAVEAEERRAKVGMGACELMLGSEVEEKDLKLVSKRRKALSVRVDEDVRDLL